MSDLCNAMEKFGKGVGTPSRYRIVEALFKGPKTVGELVKVVRQSQPAVSQHLKTLKDAGLVVDERRGKEVLYALDTGYILGLLKNLSGEMHKQKKNIKKSMDYSKLASEESVGRVVAALKERNVEAIVVESRAEALAKIKGLIPSGASINNGSSTTLNELGYIDYLKSGTHGWNNLHAAAIAEKDPAKQAELRNASLFAEYYLGSVHAIAETGEMIIASASGSQLPPIVFTSKNIIFVAGTQKIQETYEEAMKRIQEYVVPLEDQRMKSTGAAGTTLAKIVTFEREPAFMGRKVRIILVKEKLGF